MPIQDGRKRSSGADRTDRERRREHANLRLEYTIATLDPCQARARRARKIAMRTQGFLTDLEDKDSPIGARAYHFLYATFRSWPFIDGDDDEVPQPRASFFWLQALDPAVSDVMLTSAVRYIQMLGRAAIAAEAGRGPRPREKLCLKSTLMRLMVWNAWRGEGFHQWSNRQAKGLLRPLPPAPLGPLPPPKAKRRRTLRH